MARKRYKPEEIVAKLRQVDVLVSQGQNMVDAIRQIGVSEVTYYRWRQEFGGLKIEQMKRLEDLELENSRLRKAVSDLTLDKLILQEAAARLRDELLNGEIFYTLREAQIVIESWRRHYNTIRPHASIGYKPPAPEVFVPAFVAWPAALRRPAPPATLAQPPTLN
jgi:putative transposase